MSQTISVMFACNDHRNGMPAGRVDQIHLTTHDGDPVELEGPALKFTNGNSQVGVGRHVYPIRSYGTWVGNWCWDAAEMEPRDAMQLLWNLKAADWGCIGAESEFFDRWRKGKTITLPHLLTAVGLEAEVGK